MHGATLKTTLCVSNLAWTALSNPYLVNIMSEKDRWPVLTFRSCSLLYSMDVKETVILQSEYFQIIQFLTMKILCLHYKDQSALFRDVIDLYGKDQTGPGAHPATCTMGMRSFLGVKGPGRGLDHTPRSSAEVHERRM
jgi:hypothetical protein